VTTDHQKKTPALKVLFVCTGNICRSPAAEFLGRALFPPDWEVRSAGVTRRPDTQKFHPRAFKKLKARGCPLPEGAKARRGRNLSQEDLEWADRVLYMTTRHAKKMLDIFGQDALRKAKCLASYDPHPLEGGPGKSVPDPYSKPEEFHVKVLDQMERALRAWLLLEAPEWEPPTFVPPPPEQDTP
jgi:protein-tyrosine phosphatase